MRSGPARAVRQDDDVVLLGAHGLLGLGAHARRAPATMPAGALVGRVGDVDRDRGELVVLDQRRSGGCAPDPRSSGSADTTSSRFMLGGAFEVEQVRPRPDERDEAHHQLLADRVDRRVRHLREVLLEVGVQQLRLRSTAPRSACRCPSSRRLPGPCRAIGVIRNLRLSCV